MKKKTLQHFMMTALLLTSASAADAQIYTSSGISLPGLHRGVPSVCDFNNDGYADIYIPGETWVDDVWTTWLFKSWSVQGCVGVNNGDGTFSFKMSNNQQSASDYTENYGVTIPAGMTEDSDGNWTFNGYGLPPSCYNCTRWLDIDCDGNVDFVTMGEGNDDWQPTSSTNSNRYILLYRNGGAAADYFFSAVDESGLYQMANERSGNNAGKSSISVGDYNNDGYPDLVIQGYYNYLDGEESIGGRVVALFKNNGDGTFSKQSVFNPLPYDECESPDGIYTAGLDADDNAVYTPTYDIKPMTHGAVMFGDLNNDGYLDIVTTGYGDGDNAGGCFYVYKNNGDGTFDQVDTSDKPFVHLYESDLAMADINGDGWLDIISLGSRRGGDGDEGKVGDIYLNACDGEFNFDQSTVNAGNGLLGASEPQLACLDINHDGYFDVVSSGWIQSKGDWGTYIAYGSSTGVFDSTYDNDETGLFHMDSGGFTFANLLNTNSLDLVAERYDGGTTTTLFSDQDYESAETPDAPASVSAEIDADGKLVVSWEAVDPAYTYNVYCKNVDTGWITMIIPADTETGKLKVIQDMQTAVRGDGETLSYSLAVPDGTYNVGVQTIKPDATTSAFTTAENVSAGIKGIASVGEQTQSITIVNGGICVNSNEQLDVTVYNTAGIAIATGTTNKNIAVPAEGVIIVKCGNKVSRLVSRF